MTSEEATETSVITIDPQKRSIHTSNDDTGIGSQLADSITNEGFREWYAERQRSNNIRNGQHFFNGLGDPKDPERHSPSQLLKCHRQTVYSERNAPEENGDPDGIFWIGTRIEEDIILPFLEQAVAGENEYLTNSIWIDVEPDAPDGEQYRIRGATDPVIVDEEAKPRLLTEIKSKRSIDNVSSVSDHHKAQAHAYMKGLSAKYDRSITEAVVIYIDRTTFDIEPIHLAFDHSFWNNRVLEWVAKQTAYRRSEELPPGEPEQSWECKFCSFRERCGKGDREFADTPEQGLLPLYVYPQSKVTEYLDYHDGKLTPTLAFHYPTITEDFDAYDWQCGGCDNSVPWDEVDWNGDVTTPPKCSECAKHDSIRFLKGPDSTDQYENGGSRHVE